MLDIDETSPFSQAVAAGVKSKEKLKALLKSQQQASRQPTRAKRGSGTRAAQLKKSPEADVKYRRVDPAELKSSPERVAKRAAKEHAKRQKAITQSGDAAAEAAAEAARKADKAARKVKKVKKATELKRSNLKKAAIGAGVGLAAYGAYRMYKRRQAQKEAAKNESLVSALDEIMYLAEEHYDVVFDEATLIDELVEAAHDYEDFVLLQDLGLLDEEEEEPEDSWKGLKSAAKLAAAGAVGEQVATSAMDKAAKKKFRKKVLKSIGLGKKRRKRIAKGLSAAAPYAKGLAAAGAAVSAAELARRAWKKRQARKKERK